jgi:hypothetical protein
VGNSSVLMQTPLSMSRVSDEALSAEGAEVARLVRLTLRGDVTAFEQIILRYESRVMTLAARLLGCKDDARDAAQEVFLRGSSICTVPIRRNRSSRGSSGLPSTSAATLCDDAFSAKTPS